MTATDRVAILVVHGIADQKPGQTVREVTRLLCLSQKGAPQDEHGTRPYEQGEIQGVVVAFERSEPAAEPAPMVQEARRQGRARRAPGTPSGFYQAHQAAVAETAVRAPGQVADEL